MSEDPAGLEPQLDRAAAQVLNASPGAPPAPQPEDILYDVTCPECGYALRGLTSDRCPECGLDITILRTTRPQIPWEYRRTLGTRRAMWQTALMLTLRHKLFCAELNRPLDRKAARRFLWLIALVTFAIVEMIAACILVVLFALAPSAEMGGPSQKDILSAAPVIGIAILLLAPVFVLVASIPARNIRMRALSPEQRASAAALMDYTAVVWLRLPIFCLVAIALALPLGAILFEFSAGMMLAACLCVMLVGIVGFIYVTTAFSTARRMLSGRASIGRFIVAAIWDFVSWTLAATLVPACAIYVYLIYLTLSVH